MNIYVVPDDGGRIRLLARMEGDGILGDFVRVVGPGESFEGVPFEWWAAHVGGHNLRDAKRAAKREKAPD
jgi:hypothetical protein